MNALDVRLSPELTRLREKRAELRESMSALEKALAAPSVGRMDFWVQRVSTALVELSGDFTMHIQMTEAADGLHPEIVRAAPRLAHAVDQLTDEHHIIHRLIDDLLAMTSDPASVPDVDAIREPATQLLTRLIRHRQRGADLVFEAYEADIGGET